METEEQPLPRLLYTTLYYATRQTEQREALEEFVDLLLSRGWSFEFLKDHVQFTIMPQSKITGFYGDMAQYWQ